MSLDLTMGLHPSVTASAPVATPFDIRTPRTHQLPTSNGTRFERLGHRPQARLATYASRACHPRGEMEVICACDCHDNVRGRGRRSLLLVGSGLFMGIASLWTGQALVLGQAVAAEDLRARLTTTASLVPTGRFTPPWEQQTVLRVPPWMLGTWQVTSKAVGFSAPQGARFLPPGIEREADEQIGTSVQYELRFVTVPDPNANGFTLGQRKEREVVVADREANIRSVTNAFQGYDAIETVAYNPQKDARRVTATFARSLPDGRSLPPQRVEVYINHIETQECLNSEIRPSFYSSELFRQVFVGVQRVEVNDYEICMGFTLKEDGVVVARQRNIVYLQPQDAAYFDAGGRAVGYYDYDLEMTRTALPGGITTSALISCAPKLCAEVQVS